MPPSGFLLSRQRFHPSYPCPCFPLSPSGSAFTILFLYSRSHSNYLGCHLPPDLPPALGGPINSLACFLALFWVAQQDKPCGESNHEGELCRQVWGVCPNHTLVSTCVSGLQGEQEPADPDYAAEIPPSGEPLLAQSLLYPVGGSSFQGQGTATTHRRAGCTQHICVCLQARGRA